MIKADDIITPTLSFSKVPHAVVHSINPPRAAAHSKAPRVSVVPAGAAHGHMSLVTVQPPPPHNAQLVSSAHNAYRGNKGLIVAPIIEEIPHENKEMIQETFDCCKKAKRRIAELEKWNVKNDQIVLLFIASLDSTGNAWHADSVPVDRAISYMIKKLEIGGHLLKIHCGTRSQWLDSENPWKKDPKFNVTILPTVMVWGTSKRIAGRKTFDLESLMVLLRD